MPIFDFKCPTCDEVREGELRKYDEVIVCKCGVEMVHVISTPAFMFKQHGGTDKGRLMQIAKKR